MFKVLEEDFNGLLAGMSVLAAVVFVVLFFVRAGYGRFYTGRWGVGIDNRWGWVVMEAPVFVLMGLFWIFSGRTCSWPHVVPFLFFQLHYFQRSFIFPFLIRGKGRMPLSVILMGMVFNCVNALMQGGWIFVVSPEGYYTSGWFASLPFVAGTAVFFAGMGINLHSDRIIRHLRRVGDTRHYLPQRGLFRYVSCANYFGEFLEWTGFAVLTWSRAGAVFALWTFANLAPRADAIRKRYAEQFPESFDRRRIKRMIPFIY